MMRNIPHRCNEAACNRRQSNNDDPLKTTLSDHCGDRDSSIATAETLIAFARSLQGEALLTLSRKSLFRMEVVGNFLEFTPGSSHVPRRESGESVATIAILLEMAVRMEKGCFVFTSNVDGQFQKAGFDPERLVECHGSIHHLQCMNDCTSAIWPADNVAPVVNLTRCRMVSEMPRCPHCGELARPNILMFNDGDWVPDRMEMQYAHLQTWVSSVQRPVVIEIGAGTAIPSVRRLGEVFKGPLIRINPRESEVHRGSDIALPTGALNGLRMLQAQLAGTA
jgi:NAD-dependent SIR2 family protein deacetylase